MFHFQQCLRLLVVALCVCSYVFGSQLDIHSGGIDLAFPHHENEVAQSEAYHQCGQWANYFLHSGRIFYLPPHSHLVTRLETLVPVSSSLLNRGVKKKNQLLLLPEL